MKLLRILVPAPILLSILLAGCSGDDNNDPTSNPPATRSCFLDSMTVTGPYSYMAVYKFNASNQLIYTQSIDPGPTISTLDYTYDQSGHLITATSLFTTTYEYNQQNLISKKSQPGNQTLYFYNGTGQIIKIEDYSYDDVTSSFKLFSYDNLEYSSTTSRNSSKKMRYDGDGNLTGTIEITYDNNINPFTMLTPSDNTLTSNNPTKMTSISLTTITHTYTYTYNEDGYPLTSTSTSSFGTPTTNVVKYHYNCK